MADPLRKAAIVLLSLPGEEADDLLRRLESPTAERLKRRMAQMEPLPPEEQQAVLREFALARGARPPFCPPSGGEDVVPLSPAGSWEFLEGIEPKRLAVHLAEEHPQVIAAVLAQLPADAAAPILEALPEPLQPTVLRRLARVGAIAPEVSEQLARGLWEALSEKLSVAAAQAENLERVAELFGACGADRQRAWLAQLEREEPQLAQRLRSRQWTLNDLVALEPAQLARLIPAVTISQWALALCDAPVPVQARLLEVFPPSAAGTLQEKLETLKIFSPASRAHSAAMQRQILEIARRLVEAEQIELREPPLARA